jgi:hypothetical protein
VQQVVDRRFNRARYDADQTVATFAARLKDAVDLDSVRDDLAGVVHQALEPAHVSVWISQRDRGWLSSASRPIITPRLGAASLLQPIPDRHDVTPSQPPPTKCGCSTTREWTLNIASRVGDPVYTQSGTPPYQPPDADLTRWDVSTDLFAVGVVLYQLLCNGCHRIQIQGLWSSNR